MPSAFFVASSSPFDFLDFFFVFLFYDEDF